MAQVASEEKFRVMAEFTLLSKLSKTREKAEEDGRKYRNVNERVRGWHDTLVTE